MAAIALLPLSQIIPYARNARKNKTNIQKVAASIKEFGWKQPIVVDKNHVIVVGHTRYEAAQVLNQTEVPVLIADDLSEQQIKAYRLMDNRSNQDGEWDVDLLTLELEELKAGECDLSLTGFLDEEMDALLNQLEVSLNTDELDKIPEVSEQTITVKGDIWLLGNHRVMCGDSTTLTDVDQLMQGKKARLLHADPPYGMGKEKEGVANDNLRNEDLDQFQLAWWSTVRSHLMPQASVYIWGNAEDLWRLWYRGSLEKTQELTVINEIVWAKTHAHSQKLDAIGKTSDEMRCYPMATERCLFLMLGEKPYNSNSDNYWQGWEPIRNYLAEEIKKVGWNAKEVKTITNSHMYGHWFTKSQWVFINKNNYEKLYEASQHQAFTRPYVELHAEYLAARKIFNGEVMSAYYASRAYFDNSHDSMTDVWQYERVKGEERFGHATPKPVAMMERVIKSSSQKNDLILEPFGGSGSTLIAAEKTNRLCYTMECEPKWVDVIVKRWQQLTGKEARLESNNKKFNEVASK